MYLTGSDCNLKQPTGTRHALLLDNTDLVLLSPADWMCPGLSTCQVAHAGNATCNATDSTFYALAISTLLTGAGTVAGSDAEGLNTLLAPDESALPPLSQPLLLS